MLSKNCDYIVAQMRNTVKMGEKKNGKEDDEDNWILGPGPKKIV